MLVSKTINSKWNEYEKVVGRNQLLNFGIIFLDKYKKPIDNEFELEELNEEFILKKDIDKPKKLQYNRVMKEG